MKVTVIAIITSALDIVTRGGTGTGGLGNNRTSEDYPNYNIVEVGQDTKKSPRDLKRLVVTQTPVENHQLTLV